MKPNPALLLPVTFSLLAGCSDPAPAADAATDAPTVVDVPATDVASPDVPAADVPAPDAGAADVPAPEDVPTTPTEGMVLVAATPWDIAIGGGYLYYTEANNVRRVPVAGGAPELMYTTGSNSIATSGIDADGARFAWTTRDANSTVRGSVYACPHAGCGATPPANLNSGESTNRIAIEGSHIFWTSGSNSIVRGTTWASPLPVGNLSRTGTSDVDVEGGDVFWVNAGLALAMRPGTVLKCPAAASSCTPTEFPVMVGNPLRIAVSGNAVYVLSTSGLYRMDRVGANLTRLADGATGAGAYVDLAADAAGVYWGDAGRLLRCDPAACAPRVIAEVPGARSQGLALDATSVYWAAGAIRRVPR